MSKATYNGLKSITVYVTPELEERLERKAKANGNSKSKEVQMALERTTPDIGDYYIDDIYEAVASRYPVKPNNGKIQYGVLLTRAELLDRLYTVVPWDAVGFAGKGFAESILDVSVCLPERTAEHDPDGLGWFQTEPRSNLFKCVPSTYHQELIAEAESNPKYASLVNCFKIQADEF